MALKENDVRFFRPLWIRLATTGVCVAWFVAESIFTRDPLWLGVSGVGIVYCVWNFFLRWKDVPVAPAEAPAGDSPAAPPPLDPPKQ